MKEYNKDLTIGLEVIYDGTPIQWCNSKGKVVEKLNKGYYVISRLSDKYVWLKADRKNAVTEHKLERKEIEGNIYELDFADITTSIGLLNMRFLHKNWLINNKELIERAKQYNKVNH